MSTQRHFLRGFRSSLTQKLILVLLAATLVPVICWGVYIYGYSMRNVDREYLDTFANNLRQLDYNFMNQVNASRQTDLSLAGETNLDAWGGAIAYV
ncbi:MAG: hypothetical protein JWR03_2065 [Cohnella sp.]|nr:hypothetical protein [Cohnella sp.]